MWTDFREVLERSHFDPATIELQRHAFYAGAIAILCLFTDVANAGETLERAAASIGRIRAEVDGFRYDVGSISRKVQ
jgi:hypothetical protein